MKKSLILAALLGLLSCCGLAAVSLAVSASGDNLEIREIASQGDSTLAQETELKLHFRDDQYRFFWNAAYRPGQMAASDFRPRLGRSGYSSRADGANLYMGSTLNTGTSSNREPVNPADDGSEVLADLVRDVAGRTPPSTVRTETLSLQDYTDVYPLEFSVYTPFMGRVDKERLQRRLLDAPRKDPSYPERVNALLGVLDHLERTFRFPVTERCTVVVEAQKNSDDELMGYSVALGFLSESPVEVPYLPDGGMESLALEYSDETYQISCRSCHQGRVVYFVPELRNAKGQLADYSLTPGYGLYRLDLTDPLPTPEDLQLVCPLDPTEEPDELMVDHSGKRLLFSTHAGSRELLHILDGETGALQQTFQIGVNDREQQRWVQLYSDNGVLLAMQYQEGFQVYTQDASGDYAYCFTSSLDGLEDSPFSLPQVFALDFAHGQLAMAVFPYRDNYQAPGCTFSLGIWNQEGLLYTGDYAVSLDRSPDAVGDRAFSCGVPDDVTPELTLSFRRVPSKE